MDELQSASYQQSGMAAPMSLLQVLTAMQRLFTFNITSPEIVQILWFCPTSVFIARRALSSLRAKLHQTSSWLLRCFDTKTVLNYMASSNADSLPRNSIYTWQSGSLAMAGESNVYKHSTKELYGKPEVPVSSKSHLVVAATTCTARLFPFATRCCACSSRIPLGACLPDSINNHEGSFHRLEGYGPRRENDADFRKNRHLLPCSYSSSAYSAPDMQISQLCASA